MLRLPSSALKLCRGLAGKHVCQGAACSHLRGVHRLAWAHHALFDIVQGGMGESSMAAEEQLAGLPEEDCSRRRLTDSAWRCAGAWEGSMAAQEQLGSLLEEGKGLLRQGRELSRGGVAYGEADALLQDAMACFEEAAAIDPGSTKVLV